MPAKKGRMPLQGGQEANGRDNQRGEFEGLISAGSRADSTQVSKRDRIHIGTSGWHYRHWKGPFYPRDLPDNCLLEHYVKHFQTAEINNTFYRLPEKETFAQWRDSVPDGFIFSVKASRYITHMKKLKEPEKAVGAFVERLEALGNKLGPILFQLPPRWQVNVDRLGRFLELLPGSHRYAFEFRDPSWFGDETDDLLAEKGAAFCIYDFERRQSPRSVTADFVYVRLHGPDGAYQGNYDDTALKDWAQSFSSWAGHGKEVFCYFDNDEKGYAALNALKLTELVFPSARG
jgi:uncharacterized protein YecE (DUF72 family)